LTQCRWSAVSRGAVLHGLEGVVQSRKLKQHYGVALCEPFRNGIDDENTAYSCIFTGLKYCNDRVSWFAAKGDEVETSTRVRIPFFSTFVGNITARRLTIIGCKYDSAPDRKKDHSKFGKSRRCELRQYLTHVRKW